MNTPRRLSALALFGLAVLSGCGGAEGVGDEAMFQNDEGLQSDLGPKTGWQQGGELVVGDPTQGFSMQANFPKAGYYTLQFGLTDISQVSDQSAQGYFAARAEVTWTVEGQSIRRVLDVGNGTTISGPGQAVKVSLYDAADTVVNGTPNAFVGLEYTASVQLSPGSRPTVGKPPTLRGSSSLTQLAAHSSVNIPVPLDAGVISVSVKVAPQTSPPYGPTEGVTVAQGTASLALFTVYDPNLEPGFVALDPGSTQVFVINDSATNIAFSLTWGIDG